MFDELDRDLPERELSSVGLQKENSEEFGGRCGGNVVSNSSFLSDGWCISISGKPCANLKIYADAHPDSCEADTIGNLFSAGGHSKHSLVASGVADTTSASEIEDPKPNSGNGQTPNKEVKEPAKAVIADPEVKTSFEENQTLEKTSLENSHAVDKPAPDAEKPNLTNSISPPKKESPLELAKNTQDFDTNTKNQARKVAEKVGKATNKAIVPSPSKAERRFNSEDGTVIYIGCKRSGRRKSNENKDGSKQNHAYCDENCQTSHPSILKPYPAAKSGSSYLDPRSGKRHQKTSTGAMDAYPVKEATKQSRPQKDGQQLVLTSDKILQTSDDRICFFRCGRDSASNTEHAKLADSYVNTMNSESIRVQTSESTWSCPEGSRCWRCAKQQRERMCSCSSPACRSHLVGRRVSFSSLDTSPTDSYPLDMRDHVPRKKSPKAAIKFVDTSEDSTGYICVPPFEGFKKPPPKPRVRSPPRQSYPKVIPCDGRCRHSVNTDPYQNYRPPPFRPLPPPLPCDFSSSDEEIEMDEGNEDVDGFTSDGSRRHQELPYQNNEEYLELVHELEETLQNRNRNRVKRAMKEFECKSKYNRPLEKPIINYEEPSESEEPIIRRISELNEKRISRCQGDCCGCRKEEQPNFQSKPKRPSKPNKFKEQAHWQQDNKSGEWFKVGENNPPRFRMPPKLTPRGRIDELPCGCACTCGK